MLSKVLYSVCSFRLLKIGFAFLSENDDSHYISHELDLFKTRFTAFLAFLDLGFIDPYLFMDGPNEIVDERTPLLKSPKPECTPIPKLQITIVLLLQLCEPICSQSLNPYVNEVRDRHHPIVSFLTRFKVAH